MMVSIIIPAYNAEKTIEKCLKSACAQSYCNLQIVVVNDGSSDNTLNIIDTLAKNDSRVKIVNQKNSGVSRARNSGIDQSDGDYVFFLDSDDYISHDTIEILLSNMLQRNADLAACEMVDEGGTAASISVFSKFTSFYADSKTSIGEKILYVRPSSAVGKLMKSSIINDNGLRFSEEISIGEDLVFTHNYLCCCKSILKLEEARYFVRNVNEGSLSKRYVCNSEVAVQRRNEAIKRTFKEFPGYEKEWNRYFLDVDAFGFVWFIQNLSLKGCPYGFGQKRKIIKDYLDTNDCASVIKELPEEKRPKNWTDRLYCFFIFLDNALLITMLFDSKELVRNMIVRGNRIFKKDRQ